MNWLSDFVRPKIKKIATKDIADNLWTKCPQCGKMLFNKELEKNDFICSGCDHHLRLPLNRRFSMLFDNGEYKLVTLPKLQEDPLNFKDSKKYSERLKTYRKNTGNDDAVKVAQGEIGGITCVIAALDFGFMGGSMGTVVGEGIVKAGDIAVRGGYPLITIAASGGARMQEGILSLMQMARTTAAPAKPQAATNGAPLYDFVFQVAAFRNVDDADRLRQRLEGQGLRTRGQKSGKLTLVMVHMRGTDLDAANLKEELQRMRLGSPLQKSKKRVGGKPRPR